VAIGIHRYGNGKSDVYVKHGDSRVVFAYPPIGPDDSMVIGKTVLMTNGLRLPTGLETARLIYEAYCGEHYDLPEFEAVRKFLEKSKLPLFNNNFVTSKGLVVMDDSDCVSFNRRFDERTLEGKLVGARNVEGVLFGEGIRFIPRNSEYAGNFDEASGFSGWGVAVASVDVEGYELLQEVASRLGTHFECDYIGSDEPESTTSALSIKNYVLELVHFARDSELDERNYVFPVRK